MNLPEQELFSTKDVAARWGKPLSYVQDLTRRGLLPIGKGFLKDIPARRKAGVKLKLTSYITRQDLERFERTDAPALRQGISMKEYCFKHKRSYRQLQRDIAEEKLNAKKIYGRWMIFE